MNIHCFVDGGHLRAVARSKDKALVNPRLLANNIAYSEMVQFWRTPKGASTEKKFVGAMAVKSGLARTIYYDARPDSGVDPLIEDYWKEIELLPDTEIGLARFAEGRGGKSKSMV